MYWNNNMKLSILYALFAVKGKYNVQGQKYLILKKFWPQNPDEMPHAAFHLSLHCLLKYLFTGIQNENG